MKNKIRFGNSPNLVFQLFASAYLFYTSFSLGKLFFTSGPVLSVKILYAFSAVFFFLFGIFLVLKVIQQIKGRLAQEEQKNESANFSYLPHFSNGNGNSEIQRFPDLFDSSPAACVQDHRDICRFFNAGDYSSSFEKYLDACKPIIQKVDADASVADDPMQFIQQAAADFICQLQADYEIIESEAKRKRMIDSDKRVLTFYTIPMIRELRLSTSELFAAEINRVWNITFPFSVFRVGSYSRLLNGFDHRFSFLGNIFKKLNEKKR